MELGFIFDLNGTIIKSSSLQEKSIIEYVKSKTVHIDIETLNFIKSLILLSTIEISKKIKEKFNINDDIERVSNGINSIKNEILSSNKLKDKKVNISYIEGFEEFCKNAKDNNIKVAIATNAPMKFINTVDKILNLKKVFGKNIFSCEHVNNVKKPDPKLFIYTMNQLNLKPQNCCIFEDSESGILAANKSGAGYIVRMETQKTSHNSKVANVTIKDFFEAKIESIIKAISN
jgi:beta-phosphoglucomutase